MKKVVGFVLLVLAIIACDNRSEYEKLVEREMEKAGVLRGKLRRSYDYKLEIQSFSKRMLILSKKLC